MSRQFRIGFSQSVYGWYYFTAETAEEAQALIQQVDDGEIDADQLPGFYEKTNGYEFEWINPLEEETK